MKVAVMGAGAFGTALAITLSHTQDIILWTRSTSQAKQMAAARENAVRLPGCTLPQRLTATAALSDLESVDVVLIAVPMQKLRTFLVDARDALAGKILVACCKGIELKTGDSPVEVILQERPDSPMALLTGPSFATDIAKGMPTALTLACADAVLCEALQNALSTPTLRLYRTTDVIGASLGGALKNVMAIACGAAIGAGLGDSARAALLTRANAEMLRYATLKGADPTTLSGLSGFGDLVLTCTSDGSRNFRFGLAIGRGADFDPTITVEGAATARAVAQEAKTEGLDLPITTAVASLIDTKLDVADAMAALLSRSLKEE